MTKLTQRESDVLGLLIKEYISTASPIGSTSIVKNGNLDLSSATIRSVLSKLEDSGLLLQPHTSAGRIPTPIGFRYYVDTIIGRHDLSDKEKDIISEQFANSDKSINNVLKRAAAVLSLISKFTGLVVMPKFEKATFKHMEFLPLSDKKILGIFVSKEGIVNNRVIEMDEDFTYADLEKITNYCNRSYYGLSLEEARAKAGKETEYEKAKYDRLITKGLLWSKKIFDESDESELLIEGENRLIDIPEFSDISELKRVMTAFEDKKKLTHLLSRAQESDNVRIFIGAESGYDAIDKCSIISSSYSKDGTVVGTIGVIGPTRMDYSHVVPVVDFTGKLVSDLLNR